MLHSLYTYYRNFMYIYQLSEKAQRISGLIRREKKALFTLVLIESLEIEAWLDALTHQTRLPAEVIIVRKSSKMLPALSLPHTVIHADGLSVTAARNAGIMLAKQEIVVVIEASFRPEDTSLLEKLVEPFDGEPALSLSASALLPSSWNAWLERPYGVPQRPSPLATWQSIAFRKIIWARVGGIPEDIPCFSAWEVFLQRLLEQEFPWCQSEARVPLPASFFPLLWSLAEQEGALGLYARWTWERRLFFVEFMLLIFLSFLFLVIPISPSFFTFVLILLGFGVIGGELRREKFSPFVLFSWWFSLLRFVAYAWGVRRRSETLKALQEQPRRRLQEILSSHHQCLGIILYFPTHDWNGMFQRPHQLARHFARKGYLFFYGTRNEVFDAVYGFHRVEENLYLVSIPAIPPETFDKISPLIVYIGAPWYASMLNLYQDAIFIYDHYDDLLVSGASAEEHLRLLEKADLVLVSSQRLMQAVQKIRSDALLIPNAVDPEWIERFKPRPDAPPPPDLEPFMNDKQPLIGYVGALAQWLDYSLFKEVVKSLPEFQFILIGIDYDGSLSTSGLLAFPNVHWLGFKPYQELFHYVWRMDVGILPFAINEITLATSPIKIFEYFACNKPVVSTPLPEVLRYEYVLIANNANDFAEKIRKSVELASSEEYRQFTQRVVLQNTWQQRVEEIDRAIKHITSGH